MTESQHQSYVIKWSEQPSIRSKWPCLKLLHHVANERNCTPAQGAQLKRMGVRRGVPDLDLPVPRGKYHGLRIEMKDEDGHLGPDQDWWLGEFREQGYFAECCHGWQAAVRVIEWYLGLGEFRP